MYTIYNEMVIRNISTDGLKSKWNLFYFFFSSKVGGGFITTTVRVPRDFLKDLHFRSKGILILFCWGRKMVSKDNHKTK